MRKSKRIGKRMEAPATIRRRLHSQGAQRVSAFTPPPHEQGSGDPSCTGGGAEPRIGPSSPDLLGNLARFLAQWLGKLECDVSRKIAKRRLRPRQFHRRCLLIKSIYCITNRLFHDYSIQQMRRKNSVSIARRFKPCPSASASAAPAPPALNQQRGDELGMAAR